MAHPSGRTYQSPARQRQADETRRRIADAARSLLLTHGYAKMTVDAIAKEAGVAAPTVYAIFRSKAGILEELLDQARFGPGFAELARQAYETSEPSERLRFVARIACSIYASESTMLDLLRGAGVVKPELAELDKKLECRRYEAQESTILLIIQAGRLREGLDATTARDVLWGLTGRELYRMLVHERGWTADQYEAWLADTLIRALLSD
ncbi:MAG TPA: helix-turn-helix domain-containing protein [Chthonomonadaceae bacterium]|nr:helix-turn-helix domain-containing protein [Chthonomonadaceae bacterium]